MLGAMGCAAPLLAHVNLLLVLYGGAALATAARLKWDPSTYVALRELFPAEYAALAAGAAAAGLALLLLPHLATAAVLARRRATTRVLLLVYAGAMCTLLLGEAALGAWLAARAARWLGSAAAAQLQDALEVREYVKPLLRYFGRWHPLPQHIDLLIQEAEEDAPRNLYVALAAVALLLVLQPLAIGLALCVARRAGGRYASSDSTVAKRIYSGWSGWSGWRQCVTFAVRIYYREKPRWSALKAEAD